MTTARRTHATRRAGHRCDVPLTEDVPRIYPRRCPSRPGASCCGAGAPSPRWSGTHFAPTALRQLPHIRQGALPGGAAGPAAAQELPGPRWHLHEVRPDHRLVARHVRRRRGRRVPGLPRHRAAGAVRRRAPAGRGGPGPTLRDAFAEFDREPIGTASIAVVHRARLLDGRTGGGQGAAARGSSTWWPPTST